ANAEAARRPARGRRRARAHLTRRSSVAARRASAAAMAMAAPPRVTCGRPGARRWPDRRPPPPARALPGRSRSRRTARGDDPHRLSRPTVPAPGWLPRLAARPRKRTPRCAQRRARPSSTVSFHDDDPQLLEAVEEAPFDGAERQVERGRDL